jgi:hypothetical protein
VCTLPEQLAACLEVDSEVARRWIAVDRRGVARKKHVSTERPYRIQPAALALLGVTPEIVTARPAAFRADLEASALNGPTPIP